jgi:hypothetical protein
MKFVCIECDEPMKLSKNHGVDDDSSLAVSFVCPSCEWGVMMLINPQETQMVRSLGVTIGGREVPAQPMEMLQTHLVRQPTSGSETSSASAEGGNSCPFSALVQDAFATSSPDLRWSAEAEERLARVPTFVRTMARQGIETFAREQGCTEITPEVMDAARERMGM